MYAVIASGGKQYRVTPGQEVSLEKLESEAGKTIEFDKVLLVADGENINIGAPYLDNAKVAAEVVEHGRGKKIKIIKFKRRKHHMKQQGHRQDFTKVKITDIKVGKASDAAEPKAAKAKADKPAEKEGE